MTDFLRNVADYGGGINYSSYKSAFHQFLKLISFCFVALRF